MTDKHLLISQSLRGSDYNDFEKMDCVGRGAFASVYKCKDAKTNEEFAMKRIQIRDAKYENTVVQEVLVYSSLDYHKRLVQFYGSQRKNNCLYIYLEYMPEGSLKDYLETNGALSEKLTSKFTKQILEGIEYLHTANIIHRDIKPANILMYEKDNIKLTDFGLSKYVANISALDRHTMCGTVKYMAPELLSEKEYNKSIDIWSLGMTVVEMYSGEQVYPKLGVAQFIVKMNNSNFQIELSKPSSRELSYFLSLAFITNPTRRPTAIDMKHTKFITLHS